MTTRGEISKKVDGEEREQKHFESVNMQMGRVQLDSDWNEAFATTLKARARALKDVIGTRGSPNDGFRVDKSLVIDHMDSIDDWTIAGPGSWKIEHFKESEGRGSIKIKGNAVLSRPIPELIKKYFSYNPHSLDGTLLLYCRFAINNTPAKVTLALRKKMGETVFAEAVYAPDWKALLLDFTWSDDDNPFETIEIRVTTNTGSVYLDRLSLDPGLIPVPDPSTDFYIQGGDGTSDGAGRYYVDGLACVKEGFETYLTQKDYPEPAVINLGANGRLIYLDVRKRTVTTVEDPDILEHALGGQDTCTREQLVAQVKVLEVSGEPEATCSTNIEEKLRPNKAGTLTAKLYPVSKQGECDFKPELNYTGLNNSLYWIEIHGSGDKDSAKFKWSRNNGADLVPITGFSGSNAVIVPDDRLLCCGDVVELCDDVSDLADFTDTPKRGKLATITSPVEHIGEEGVKITLDFSIDDAPDKTTAPFSAQPPSVFPRTDVEGKPLRHPKLRKWHGVEFVKDYLGVDIDAKELEHGIRLTFSGDHFYHGDYWQFTARVNTGSLEELHDAPPMGPMHHYAPLALTSVSGGITSFTDCRETFLPLTGQHATKVGVDTNYCVERPKGADDATVRTPENVQQALDNLCGYIRHLRADNIGVDTNDCISRPGGPHDKNPHDPDNVQQALDNLCGYIKKLTAEDIGVAANFCIERPGGPQDKNPHAPLNIQEALDNLCGYIRKTTAGDISVTTNFCIERPGGPEDSAHSPQNIQRAFDNLCGYIRNLTAESILFKDNTCAMGVKNVQDAIDRLCRIERHDCGILTVGDGIHSKGQFSDIQTAINSLPADVGGKVCIGAGLFELSAPIAIAKKQNIQIVGLGTSTLISIKGWESAMIFGECKNVKVNDLRIKVVHPKKNPEPVKASELGTHLSHLHPGLGRQAGRNGALTLIDSDNISVEGCTFSTPALNERELTCLTVKTSRNDRLCSNVKIADNVFIPGDRQIGVLVINGKDVTISGNRIHRDRGFTYQGIVVGGNKGENIRIENNLIRRVFQGIHVGVSHTVVPPQKVKAKQLKRKAVDFFFKPEQIDRASQVTIRGNTIAVVLPDFFQRERHGIFAGNCDNLMIKDNSISIEYASKKSPIDGIRVFGYLGPLAVIRENNITGAAAGGNAIYFTALKPDETKKTYGALKWMIIDNMTYCEDPKQQAPKIYVDTNTKKYIQIIRNC